MNRRNFLTTSAGILGGIMLKPNLNLKSKSSSSAKKPNILFVNTDDQAQWAVGAYGNPEIHTPNMDKLASQGMKFTNAFTCPVCSPSRAMVMTGLYNHQVGIEDWINPTEPVGLPPNVPTLAEELHRAGYRTALIGKWHLGHTKYEFYPTSRGFDYFMGMLRGGDSASMMNPELLVNGRIIRFKGGITDILADYAIRFLRTHREQPFALFFHPRRPHAPYVPVPEEDWKPYKGKKLTVPKVDGVSEDYLREITEKYYASVTSVDRNLGRILKELEDLGIANNTIVIFTGDNGYNIGHRNGMLHKGNGRFLPTNKTRPNIFDTSAKVPLFIRFPGIVRSGSVCGEMLSTLDYFPTFLDIIGAKRRPGLILEGMSMFPLLKEQPTVWRDKLFLIYNQHHYIPHAQMRMIRTREWKLIHHYEKGMVHELFDLKNDPEETTNLYGNGQVKNIQVELQKQLVLWEKRTGAYPFGG